MWDDVSCALVEQIKQDMLNPDFLEGYKAHFMRAPLDMRRGQNWALGWVSANLLGKRAPALLH